MYYKFIGKNGSCGFIKGELYDLELYQNVTPGFAPGILACSKNKQVAYSSMKTFNQNWEKVSIFKGD